MTEKLSADHEQQGEQTATLPETFVEAACRWLGVGILLAMLTMISVEVFMRTVLNYSWEGTDEYGGYLLVALTFISLSVTLARGGFHQMQLVRIRLSPRQIIVLDTVMHVLSLLFMIILVWQFSRMGLQSWRNGDMSMTAIRTPLWMPRAVMVIGSLALCYTLVRFIISGIGKIRAMRREA
ncbi:TRAP-type mannitol/chloroaromatic compound transport system permease small subunit [Mesorhizobium sp. J18]|uniref:TRAP transporter small permease n=1 Tax=Mesorhizobium sp. J18 TaxID=935263 RepID=UPI00119C3BB1|nr:TRAP transporter small permease [Mesorhizobium sp. J18]TWG96415.1 TRAP-type mannitol/chloroaromatic compound transport system permease small subunit [Mesorhizobium sp. J18]